MIKIIKKILAGKLGDTAKAARVCRYNQKTKTYCWYFEHRDGSIELIKV